MYRSWHGPIVGRAVSHIWEGYATRLFLEFGQLGPADYVLRNGAPGAPKGEFSLNNAQSMSSWRVTLGGREIGGSEVHWKRRARCLLLLKGRRLQSLEIDETSRSTRLTFAHRVVLTARTYPGCRREPHWTLRVGRPGDRVWRLVLLHGANPVWRDWS